jgi:hypothetical protein
MGGARGVARNLGFGARGLEVKATPEEIANALEGNRRKELLFVLRQDARFLESLAAPD